MISTYQNLHHHIAFTPLDSVPYYGVYTSIQRRKGMSTLSIGQGQALACPMLDALDQGRTKSGGGNVDDVNTTLLW
jgi:hypothetical protein